MITKLPGYAHFIPLCCTGCGARPRADGDRKVANFNYLSYCCEEWMKDMATKLTGSAIFIHYVVLAVEQEPCGKKCCENLNDLY